MITFLITQVLNCLRGEEPQLKTEWSDKLAQIFGVKIGRVEAMYSGLYRDRHFA